MHVEVKWDGDERFKAITDSKFEAVIDRDLEQGPRPMEYILVGLGGCASVDVMSMLKKSRQDVTDCVAILDAERADAVPAVFTKIHVIFKVTGRNLKPSAVERAAKLSAEQYCSVSKMLEGGGVEITHSVEIHEAE
jgi:putative redox protein